MSNVTSITEARKSRSWNRARWDWQAAIFADSALPDRAKLIAAVLVSKFAHHESAECRPGLAALAAALATSEDTVKRGLRSLEDGGWITRGGGGGRGHKLAITFLFPSSENGGSFAPLSSEKGGKPARVPDGERGASLHGKGCSSARPPRPPYKAEPNLNQKARAQQPAPTRSMHPVPIGSTTAENWDRWLQRHFHPPLSGLAERLVRAGEEFWLLPIRSPPADGCEIEARMVGNWIAERRSGNDV